MAVLSVRAGIRAAAVVVAGLFTSGAALAGPVQFNPGDLLATAPNADAVIRVNPQTGATSVLLSGTAFQDASRIVLSPDGEDLYVLGFFGGIVRVDVATGATTQLVADLQTLGLDVRPDGSLVIASRPGDSGPRTLYRTDADGGNRQVVSPTLTPGALNDLVLDPTGNVAYFTDMAFGDVNPHEPGPGEMGGAVFRVDLLTGLFAPVTTGGHLITPHGLVLASDGRIFVGDQGFENTEADGRVIAFDPLTGQQTLISSGGLLDGVFGLDFDANGRLIVANPGQNILGIDVTTGAQTVVAAGYFFTDVLVVPGGANAIPLPAAAWAGLLVMSGIAARRGVRRIAGR